MIQNDNAATVVLHLVVVSVFHLHPNVGGLGRTVYDFGAILLVEAEERRKRPGSASASISTRLALGDKVETRGRAAGFVQGSRLADAITLGIVFSLGEQNDLLDILGYTIDEFVVSRRGTYVYDIMLGFHQERGVALIFGHVVIEVVSCWVIVPIGLLSDRNIINCTDFVVLIIPFCGKITPFPS